MLTAQLFEHDCKLNLTVAGVDEVGRGPLAGPVVCGACIMPMDFMIDKINDSKTVSPSLREKLYDLIMEKALAVSFGVVEPEIIDKINILNATKLGMKRAVEGLKQSPQLVLVDAVTKLDIAFQYASIIKGDTISYSIAAASIAAKVYRDRMMEEYDRVYPEYRFKNNKGYGTQEHIAALLKYGKCPIHRETFIKNFFKTETENGGQ